MSVVWITGAKGFIGRRLARKLKSAKNEVAGLGHGHWPDAMDWGVSAWINGEISGNNLEVLQRATGRPEVIYHLAGGSSVGASLENPRNDFVKSVEAASEVLEWIRLESPGTKIVIVSSAAVYGASHVGRILESDTIRPYSPYGYHKHLVEELCRCYAKHYGVEGAIVRLFSVYGHQLQKQLLWDLCCKLECNQGVVTLDGAGNELRDWTDVRDVVEALSVISEKAGEVMPTINVGTGLGTPVRDIASMVGRTWSELTGVATRIDFSGDARPGDPFSLIADVSLMKCLGIEPAISVELGVAEYVRWFVLRIKG